MLELQTEFVVKDYSVRRYLQSKPLKMDLNMDRLDGKK